MKDYLALLITGVGIGFFLGLSESPLLSQILVPILTVIAGLLSILTGQKNIDGSGEMGTKSVFNKRISPLPIMWIIIGMVVGSSVGLLAKNYDIFRNRNLQLINQIDSESDTVLHESQEEICSIPHICILKGAELVSACRNVDHAEIKSIIQSPMINTDSLKSKINQICNCKQ